MVSVPPMCMLQAIEEGTTRYPGNVCLKCNWRPGQEIRIWRRCVDPDYYQPPYETKHDYKDRLQMLMDGICYHTGMNPNNEDQLPLIMMYTLLAMHVGENTTPEMVHDAWSLWTAYNRKEAGHTYLVNYGELADSIKGLDDLYVWAIHQVAKELV